MKSPQPTDKDIRELVAFLPILYTEDFDPIKKWHFGEKNSEGVMHFPYTEYRQEVEDFFNLASKECWLDRDYLSKKPGEMLKSSEVVANASLNEIKTMLTFCVRGERFCEGHWGATIRQGAIKAILERLQQLSQEQEIK